MRYVASGKYTYDERMINKLNSAVNTTHVANSFITENNQDIISLSFADSWMMRTSQETSPRQSRHTYL
jgi:butyrate kinase